MAGGWVCTARRKASLGGGTVPHGPGSGTGAGRPPLLAAAGTPALQSAARLVFPPQLKTKAHLAVGLASGGLAVALALRLELAARLCCRQRGGAGLRLLAAHALLAGGLEGRLQVGSGGQGGDRRLQRGAAQLEGVHLRLRLPRRHHRAAVQLEAEARGAQGPKRDRLERMGGGEGA